MPGRVAQDWGSGVNSALPDAPFGTGHSHGGMYVSTAVETVISVQSTPTKALGTTTVSAYLEDFEMSANNRLTYLGRQTSHFHVAVALSMTSAANIQVTSMTIGKNGTSLPETEIQRKIGTGTDVGAVAVVGLVELAKDDYLEMFVANETSTGNLTVEFMNFTASEVG